MNTPAQNPKEQALTLLADLSAAQAALKAAAAPFEAQKAAIAAAITKATVTEKAAIADLEHRLKLLALEHGPELFGSEHGSIIENGLRLLVTPSEAVELLDEEEAICKRIERDLRSATTPADRLALSSLLRVKLAINKEYALANYEHAPDWFEHYGVSIEQRKNASVRPAPKPKGGKSKKAPKAPVEEAQPEAQAA